MKKLIFLALLLVTLVMASGCLRNLTPEEKKLRDQCVEIRDIAFDIEEFSVTHNDTVSIRKNYICYVTFDDGVSKRYNVYENPEWRTARCRQLVLKRENTYIPLHVYNLDDIPQSIRDSVKKF